MKPTVSYDGEILTISPIKISTATDILNRFDRSEICSTFGVDTLAVMPSKTNETVSAFNIYMNGNHTTAFHLVKDLLSCFHRSKLKDMWMRLSVAERLI
ncbi:MAG TPA: hypothetical protein ACHBX0_08205 [Arsenophonus sp.]